MASHGPPPPDVTSGPMMLKAIWSMDAIAALLVALRLVAAGFILRKITLADYLMVAALAFALANTSAITLSAHYGLGRHIMYLSPYQIVHTLEWQTIAEPLGILSPTFGRVSFAVYMMQLLGTDPVKRYTLHVCIWFSVFVNILTIILIFVQCEHVQSIYDTHYPGWCWSKSVQANYGYFQGACNTIVDLVLTILPAIVIWQLKLTTRTRLALLILLSLSIFAAVASTVKTVYLSSIGAGGDLTHNLVRFVIWFTVENTVVIAAASIPTIRPLFLRRNKNSTTYTTEYKMHGYPSSGTPRSLGYVNQRRSRRGDNGAVTGEEVPAPAADKGVITKDVTITKVYLRSNSRGESEDSLTAHVV